MHSPHDVQSVVTKRAFSRTVTLKFPTNPSTDSTSLSVRRWMFSRRSAETIFGVRMQAAQSRVGKVLSNRAIIPPMVDCRSTR